MTDIFVIKIVKAKADQMWHAGQIGKNYLVDIKECDENDFAVRVVKNSSIGSLIKVPRSDCQEFPLGNCPDTAFEGIIENMQAFTEEELFLPRETSATDNVVALHEVKKPAEEKMLAAQNIRNDAHFANYQQQHQDHKTAIGINAHYFATMMNQVTLTTREITDPVGYRLTQEEVFQLAMNMYANHMQATLAGVRSPMFHFAPKGE